MILAYYGLLDASLRYSRGLIMLSGVVGTVMLLGLHEILYRLGILKLITYDEAQQKAVVVGSEDSYEEARKLLSMVPAAPELVGRISTNGAKGEEVISEYDAMRPVLYTAGIGEIIFCPENISYGQLIDEMQMSGEAYDYKIHLRGSRGFVGSNSSHAAGQLYTTGRRYALAQFAQQRNKRVFDLVASLAVIFASPILLFIVRRPLGALRNAIHVLIGQKTWVGYSQQSSEKYRLPQLKAAVVPPYNLIKDYTPDDKVKEQLAEDYAVRYTPGVDAGFFWRNIRWIGNL
jgi:hypothetical protein